MKQYYLYLFGLVVVASTVFGLNAWAEMPKITGKPVIDTPQLLDWPTDRGMVAPNLNDPTSNTLLDVHGIISSCDLVLSTEGNYHPALRDIWPIFLAKFKDRPLHNCLYTTSPPIIVEQIKNETLEVGNLYFTCMPSAAVASGVVMDKLVHAGYADGPIYLLYQDRGAVILVKKSNPKRIRSVWDLGRKGVRLVTPNPQLEPGAFENYLTTLRIPLKSNSHSGHGEHLHNHSEAGLLHLTISVRDESSLILFFSWILLLFSRLSCVRYERSCRVWHQQWLARRCGHAI